MKAPRTFLLLGALVLSTAVLPQAVRAQDGNYCLRWNNAAGWTIDFTENLTTGLLIGTGSSGTDIDWLASGARVALDNGESHLVITLINPNMHDAPGCTDGTGFADYGSYSGRVTGGEDGVYTYNPRLLNSCGPQGTQFLTVTEGGCVAVAAEGETTVSEGYELEAAYPNPFAEETLVRLTVREAQHVRAEVYDALGRRVGVLHDGPVAAEVMETLRLDGGGLAGGVYVVRFTGETFAASRTVFLVK